MALFNLSSRIDVKLEKELLKRGIHGVFEQNCLGPIFIKGIKKLERGQYWFSRDSLSQALRDLKEDNEHFIDSENPLTEREKEVLLYITSGASNHEIAYELNISPNTVKVHIYNIYRKTNVKNRFQASLWAVKNF